ncbi:MAG: hypothetical protein JKY48_20105, partial [Flavobacteriales bacterium]|nr:hypothetical protein [Flavobacteriales bacterium]
MKNILIIIPARGGSKGIPRKNVRALNGKPLIGYSIKNALSIDFNQDVYVSSEDDEILNISKKNGAKTHRRPSKLSKDDITLDSVIFDAFQEIQKIEGKEYDFIVTLQPTSPLLKTESLTEALTQIIEDQSIDTIISATNDTHLSWRKEGEKYFPNHSERLNRQYLTPNYKETGGFLITRNSIISETNRIGEQVQLHELDAKQAIDIDNFEDWNICEYYLKRKRIVIAVSGYQEIGLGHIYNALIVANEILDHELIFFCDRKSELGLQKIKQSNYDCLIQQTNNLQEEILNLNPDIIIYDRLDSKEEDVQDFKKANIKLIHFEDLGDGAKHANLVFNAIYPEKKLLNNHFFGPSYFCARDEFILSNSISIEEEVSTILLAFGGVDPNNLTKSTLQAIVPFCERNDIKLKVVCGFGYKEMDSIADFKNVE